jgi:SHS family lactate transporter-like MFS transporter
VIASSVVLIEAMYAQHASYSIAMALTAISVFVLASLMAVLGREKHGADLGG